MANASPTTVLVPGFVANLAYKPLEAKPGDRPSTILIPGTPKLFKVDLSPVYAVGNSPEVGTGPGIVRSNSVLPAITPLATSEKLLLKPLAELISGCSKLPPPTPEVDNCPAKRLGKELFWPSV